MTRTRKRAADKLSGEIGETTAAIEKRYGKGTVTRGSEVLQPNRISTGIFVLDLALLGGIPESRVTLVNGRKHGGKSLLTMLLSKSAQKQHAGMVPVLIDTEGTYDEVWADTVGVDTSNLLVSQPDSGEMAVDIADGLLNSQETSIIIVDSLAGLTPTREIDSSAEDAHVGIHAKLVTGMCRKLTQAMIRERKRGHQVPVVFINQYRAQIGGFSPGFGEALSQPGGKAVEHYAAVQLEMKNKENKGRNAEGTEVVTHNEHPFSIKKNKTCNGPRSGEFVLVRDDDYSPELEAGQIDNAPTLLTYAKRFHYYTGAGKAQYLEFDDVSLKFGKQDECITALREDNELSNNLYWNLIAHQAKVMKQKDEFCERLLNMRQYFE